MNIQKNKTKLELEEKLKEEDLYLSIHIKKIEELVEKTISSFSTIGEDNIWEYVIKLVDFRLAFKKGLDFSEEGKEYEKKQDELKKVINEEIIESINNICRKIV